MKKQLEIINTTVEKVLPQKKDDGFKANFWSFLTTTFTTFFAFLYIVYF
jgi:hypothetical protein